MGRVDWMLRPSVTTVLRRRGFECLVRAGKMQNILRRGPLPEEPFSDPHDFLFHCETDELVDSRIKLDLVDQTPALLACRFLGDRARH